MKSSSCLKFLLVTAVFALVFAGAGNAATITEPSYSVQSLTITPSTLLPGETGQLDVTILNTGLSPLVIDKVSVTDSDGVISVKHPAITALGAIGAGKSLTITLPISAKSVEGTFIQPSMLTSNMTLQQIYSILI